jgi:hypothetical protein
VIGFADRATEECAPYMGLALIGKTQRPTGGDLKVGNDTNFSGCDGFQSVCARSAFDLVAPSSGGKYAMRQRRPSDAFGVLFRRCHWPIGYCASCRAAVATSSKA